MASVAASGIFGALLYAVSASAAFADSSGSEILVIGTLGDSISTGFNAQRLGDNRDLSWSSGSSQSVRSHLQRIAAGQSPAVTARNEAIAGSTVHELERQITRLLAHDPDYITLTIGANDVCSWNSNHLAELDAFEEKLTSHLDRIVHSRPRAKILLAPIPSLYNLWEVASSQTGCQARWDLFGICRPLLGSGATTGDRQAFVERWQDANNAIARVAARFPGQVIHDPEVAGLRFEWHHVAPLDCFHPSVAGQNLLAEATWNMLD